MKRTKLEDHEFTFVVHGRDIFPLDVEIYRDGVLYCTFQNGTFLKANSFEKFNEMPINEKVSLWHHINYYGNDVGDHELTLHS